ncbi:hypothetical protein NT6N_29620 [Oceaniferula spumae]|uniref:YdhG-like domain-containing protein n=1 Tax=Oceaniferula spumae TaxID=2979115 RepID=A0AAT9FPV0_9BACT
MKRDSQSPQHYIDSVEGEQQELLLKVRALIQNVAPDATEGIEYDMLAYGELCNLAAQKNYVSLYVSPKALAEYHQSHPDANCGKCCLRLRSLKQFDPAAVKTLLERANQLLEQGESGCC